MKILFFFGTRPEAIKMAPVIREFRRFPEQFDLKVCVSGQHREMLDQVLSSFDVRPDFDLDIMKPGQDLFSVTTAALSGIQRVLASYKPDWLFVQGDTTTTFAGALAAFYEKVKIAHIEAGLRSFNKYSPFPEEINRVLTTHIADLHFAPTPKARENLLRESVPGERISTVGNTSIDALLFCLDQVSEKVQDDFEPLRLIDMDKRIILVTGHRRESFGGPFRDMCYALRAIARTDGVTVVYPVHLNPNVRKPVFDILRDMPNVHLLEPLDYPALVWLMHKSYFVLTDSGGIQEEAPSLGKPVLVMRDVTERTEGIEAGTAKLVGMKTEAIVTEAQSLLSDRDKYERMSRAVNPYGDGKASRRIVDIIGRL